jgi:hypothetical protein
MSIFFVQKTKYRAWFFIKEHGTYKLKKKMKFNPLKPIIKYGDKPYEPILNVPSFSNGLKDYFFFEIGNKRQISYIELTESDAELKDLMFAKEVVVQAFKSLGERVTSINWIHLVLVALAMFLGGWILGNYIPIGVLP